MKNRISKNITALVLIMAMAVMSGCGSSSDNGGGSSSDSGDGTKKAAKEEKGMDIKADIEEQVIAEKDGLKITATGLGSEKETEFFINIKVENGTDKFYQLVTCDVTVNGYCMRGYMYDDIQPGESETRFEIDGADVFKYVDIGEIGEIGLHNLKICETVEGEDEEGEEAYREVPPEQYDNPFFLEEKVTIQTSAYDEMKETALPEGEELYNAGGVQFIRVEADEEDKENGYCDIFFLKNDSSDTVSIGIKDASVNDIMQDGLIGHGILSGGDVLPGYVGITKAGLEAYMLSAALGVDDEEEAKLESIEGTICLNKEVMDEEYGEMFWENFAEIPYSYTAK